MGLVVSLANTTDRFPLMSKPLGVCIVVNLVDSGVVLPPDSKPQMLRKLRKLKSPSSDAGSINVP